MGMVRNRAQPVKVVLVEDHPDFREALTRSLEASDDHEVVGICKDLPAGLQLIDAHCPDVLLVDLGLPSGRGLTLIRAAQRRWGAGCISAVVTMTGDEDHLMEAVGAGAKGYLFKSDQPAQWLQGINALASGQSPAHPKIAQRLLHQLTSLESEGEHPARDLLIHIASGYTIEEAAAQLSLTASAAGQQLRTVYDAFLLPVPDLSPRELQLLSLLNKGYAFRTCAELMKVSESTTKTQAARAYQKLGASNLQMALYEARSSGLIA
jgi:DNA-binding NarL/FixJ family response regulator